MASIQFTLAGRYLWRRKLRTILTMLAILLGTLLIFGMNIVLPTLLQSFQSNMLAAAGQVDVTISHESSEAFSEKHPVPYRFRPPRSSGASVNSPRFVRC